MQFPHLKGSVDLVDDGARFFQAAEEGGLDLVGRSAAEQRAGLADEPPEAIFEVHELPEGLLENGGEAEEPKCVAGGRGVEDHDVVVERLHLLHELAERHGLVDARDGVGELRHERLDSPVFVVRGARGVLHASLHLVQVLCGVDLHGGEVGEALDGGGLAADLEMGGSGEL